VSEKDVNGVKEREESSERGFDVDTDTQTLMILLEERKSTFFITFGFCGFEDDDDDGLSFCCL
jgi:hypothetical protein